MKKTLLFLTLITASFYSSAQAPFSYDWHSASDEQYYVAQDIEVLNDTVYTLYVLTVTDSVDANFASGSEDWIYTNQPGFADVALITKHTVNGTYIESFRVFETTDLSFINHLLIDNSGKIILWGTGQGITADFNPEGVPVNSYTATLPSSNYKFVSFYNLDGTYDGHFEYTSAEVLNAVTDGVGNLYLAGYFQSTTDLDFTAGVDNHTSNGGYDGFVMKINITNQSYEWAKTIGGLNSDGISYIDYDNGKLLLNGNFQSPMIDLDPSSNIFNVSLGAGAGNNEFVTIWDTNGGFESGLSLKSIDGTELGGVSFDDEGNTYIIGTYFSPDTVNVNPNGIATYLDTTLVANYSNTYFVLKYSPNLVLEWQQTIIGSNNLDIYRDYDKSAIKNAGSYMLVNLVDLGGDMIQRINGGAIDTVTSVSNYSSLLIALNKNTGVFEYLDIYQGDNTNNNYTYFSETFVEPNGNIYAIGNYYNAFDFNNYDNITVLDSAYGGWQDSPFILKLNFNGFVGVDEIENETIQTIVYPNPTNNTINIQSNAIIQKISIIDINGRVVLNEKVNSKTISNINISQLNNGIYFIKVIDEKGNSSINKIIKQ